MKSKREIEEERRKTEEEAAAQAYAEFVATFQEAPSQKGKVWVKAGTFDAGSRKEDTKDKGKLYKPTARLAELAEKFSTAEKAASHASNNRPEKPGKKKEKDKKRSNLELFKEELKMMQEERAERHRIKDVYHMDNRRQTRFEVPDPKPSSGSASEDPKMGSYDSGDPNTTNLYLGNLSPKITEQRLMELFGRYGPLASIKIMWPRTDDERSRGRNCGFVAYMNRKDGERALAGLNGRDIDGFEMKLGWGKCVPIPTHPIYIPPALRELTMPPPPSGLPFNAQPDKRDKSLVPPLEDGLVMDKIPEDVTEKILQRAVVKVVIPTESNLLHLIHRTIEFVIREGPIFEAMIMNKELNNPDYRFLFENQSPAHVYYRWKLYSILQGDATGQWSTKPFRMFNNGSVWKPPTVNPYLQGMPEELVKLQELEDERNRKGSLSNAQRNRVEHLIRHLSLERAKIGEAMVWCIEHAEAAEEICQCISESVNNLDTSLPKKIARLCLVSDILHNCSVKVQNASFFRKMFQDKLAEIFEGLYKTFVSIESRLRAEHFKQRVMACCRAWEDWAIYPHDFLISLQNIFLGLVRKEEAKFEPKEEIEEPVIQEDMDGVPLEDVDGVPFHDSKEDIDGVPLKVPTTPLLQKSAAISALQGYSDDDDEEDIDGAPMEENVRTPVSDSSSKKGPAPGFVPSKWESVSPSKVEEQAMTLSKWDMIEQQAVDDESGSDKTPVYDRPNNFSPKSEEIQDQHSHSLDDEDLDGIPLEYEDYKRRSRESSDEEEEEEDDDDEDNSEYSEDSRGFDRISSESNEERRARLREVEVKVLQYQDELERGLRPLKSGYSVGRQVQHYRNKLLRKVDREVGSERRHRHHTMSPVEKKAKKRSRSPHKTHRTKSRSPGSRRHRSRSPHKRRSHSRSPSRKHRKKSRR